MTPIEFANYQRQLNAIRLNKLREMGKIEPTPLLLDDDFDASIEDMNINIVIPHLETPKPKVDEPINSDSKALW